MLSGNPRMKFSPLALFLVCLSLPAVTPSQAEFAACRQWAEKNLGPGGGAYSYRYAGQRNGTAPELAVRPEVSRFDDFPAVEWLLRFQNSGSADSPILENVLALDSHFNLPTAKGATLHWAIGGVASFDDFKPRESALDSRHPFHLESGTGRSSDEIMPFFNIEAGGRGVILAIGWSGTWSADFVQTKEGGVEVRAGMRRTHLKLLPGEQIRTPRMLALFYEGDRWRGQNLLRQFLLAHHRPQVNGKPLIAPITNGNWGATPADVHLDNIQKIAEHKLPIDYYWIDAEWHGSGPWWKNVGNWDLNRTIYPDGMKPLSDALARSGRHLMLWFEPERVVKGSAWYREHPDWLLQDKGDNTLLDLGNPAARKFVTDFISDRIDEYGLGCYRQDFNIEPGPFWTAADAPDRQGITEIRYIEGLYAFWDGLLARHPGLLIDNCASGGRRLDIETMGRAVPYWRTDGPRDPIAHQAHTWGLLPWYPLNATSEDRAGDDYEFRSSMSSSLCLNLWIHDDGPAKKIPADFPFDWTRRTLEQYLSFRELFYGDFYPLTEYTQTRDAWMAYQLDRPDLHSGLIVALKRPASPFDSASLKLHGLDPAASYRVEFLDTKTQATHSGAQLMNQGVRVSLARNPDSALIRYTLVAPEAGARNAKK